MRGLARLLRAGWRLRAGALAVAGALALGACGSAGPPPASPAADSGGLRAWDVAAGRFVSAGSLVEALAARRYVLLGELHDSPLHHRLQARLLRALVAAGRHPAVVFEMLSADQAAALAEATAGPGADAAAVRRAVAWDASGWPRFALYAPVFEAALGAGLPLAAGDLGGEALDALRQEGTAGLPPAQREALGLDAPATEAERAVLGAAIREGHCDLLPAAALPRMIEVQRARDAHLAWALRRAARRPGVDGAVLIAGAGHTRRDVAVPAWLRRLEPGAPVASLAFVEAETLPEAPARALAARFHADAKGAGAATPPAPYDFVVFTAPTPREDPCEVLRRQLASPHAEPAEDAGAPERDDAR